jgi:hydrogenase/urease accessory protein HupE
MIWAVLLVPLLVLRAAPCEAHAVGVSRGEYLAEGSEVRAHIVFARTELLTALPDLDADRDGVLGGDEVEHARAELSGWIRRGVIVRVPSGACTVDVERATLTEQDGLDVAARYRCPDPTTTFSVRLDLLADLSLGHRHLLTATSPARTVQGVLYAAAPMLALAGPGAERASGSSWLFGLGVEHIVTGYDHLLFLLALVLVGGSLRSNLAVVTAFTLAHSVTLAVAATGIWIPSPALVEPAIALSIAYVGLENCVAPDTRRRWRLTFLFGLIHGFGFAGALHEIAISRADLPIALVTFNLGVEAGQLAVLALVLPATTWLARRTWFATGGLQLTSIAISAAGLCWFVARVRNG